MSATDLDSQDSVDAESSEYDDDEDGDDDYYYANGIEDEGMASDKDEDPEIFEFVIISPREAQEIFDSLVIKTSQEMKARPLKTFLSKPNRRSYCTNSSSM